MIKAITSKEFSEAENAELSIVDFSAEWCGPCKMLAPVLEALSEEYNDKISFYKIDTDESSDTAADYLVQNIPTLIMFKNGKEAARLSGFRPKTSIEQWIRDQTGLRPSEQN